MGNVWGKRKKCEMLMVAIRGLRYCAWRLCVQVGLEGAGKKTLLQMLKLGPFTTTNHGILRQFSRVCK